MNPAPWTAEWKRALARPRLLALNVGIPLLLVAPVALGGAPPAHAGAVYTVLFVLFGTFGAAVPLVRDGESGLLGRLALTGISPGSLLLQRAGAGALLDLVELLPSVVVVSLASHRPGQLPVLLAMLGATLLVANLLGFWVAALAASVAETALFSAVATLLLLHGSGVFRTPSPGSPGAILEGASPFTALHESLLGLAGGTLPPPGSGYPALAAWSLAGLALTWALAPVLVSALKGPRGP